MTRPDRPTGGYFTTPSGFVALAHRGFARPDGLDNGLENSMAAFAAAVDLGYTHVETDAHGTTDGTAVALHDSHLDRTTDATGAVAELTWDTVRRARIGGVEPVPRLVDILGTWPTLRVNIDVKADSGIRPVAEAIEHTRAHDRVCLASFSAQRRRRTLAHLSRPVATSAGTDETRHFVLAARTRVTGLVRHALRDVDALQVPPTGRLPLVGRTTVVDEATVAAAHATGRHVHVWTINDATQMAHLIDLGVDGIVTDRADLLRDLLHTRGMWA